MESDHMPKTKDRWFGQVTSKQLLHEFSFFFKILEADFTRSFIVPQVVMAEMYAEKNPSIFYASAHPGWADTPSVRSALPDFYKRMEGRLRSPEEGADTINWLAISASAPSYGSGKFFQGMFTVL